MAKFDKLSDAFEQGKEGKDTAKVNDVGALRRSLAVISAVDKLKNQGIKITQKAKLDYVLALRFVERAGKAAGRDLLEEYRQQGSTSLAGGTAADGSTETAERNPKDHPAEFEKAFQKAMKVVSEVEALQKQGKPVPDEVMETYTLCKKFLEKYT
jgi:hypothetical protein